MELKLLRSTDSFRRDLKTFLFNSVYGHQDTDRLCDAPSSSSRGHNTSASLTVTVTVGKQTLCNADTVSSGAKLQNLVEQCMFTQ